MKLTSGCLLLAALVASVALSGVLSSNVATAADETQAALGDAANGKKVFLADGCFYCHGTTGAGGGNAGPRLAPNPLPLAGVKAKLRTASGRMPVYSSAVLKDSEIADIVAYLQSIPKGKDAKDIPLLH